jgi:hypothetical protein
MNAENNVFPLYSYPFTPTLIINSDIESPTFVQYLGIPQASFTKLSVSSKHFYLVHHGHNPVLAYFRYNSYGLRYAPFTLLPGITVFNVCSDTFASWFALADVHVGIVQLCESARWKLHSVPFAQLENQQILYSASEQNPLSLFRLAAIAIASSLRFRPTPGGLAAGLRGTLPSAIIGKLSFNKSVHEIVPEVFLSYRVNGYHSIKSCSCWGLLHTW